MAVLRFDGATAPIDMSDADLVAFDTAEFAGDDFWSFLSTGGDDLALSGEFLEFDAQGRATSGTITDLEIDIDNNSVGSPEVILSGIAAPAAAMDDDPRLFWDIALRGNDIINVQGLDAGDVGSGRSTVFGDDLQGETADDRVVSDSGGNDVFITGDGAYTLIGDVHRLQASAGQSAIYVAGDDLITGSRTNALQQFIGDAFAVNARGQVQGGDDRLSSASTNGGSVLAGDVFRAVGASEAARAAVSGGDDELTGLNPVQVPDSRADLIGDAVQVFDFAGVGGGSDTISGSNQREEISGDVGVDFSNAGTQITGGDDSISGGGGADRISGDLLDAGGNATLAGGDDTIRGGAGGDEIFGEVGSGALAALADVSGGADQLFGEGGDDLILGQTGADFLSGGNGRDSLDGGAADDRLFGGAGNDELAGGGGADTFVFNTTLGSANVDDIADFSVAADSIALDNAVFTALATGGLAAAAFRVGSAAADADDRIVYDSAAGDLFFDSDGSGAGAAIRFATLDAGLALTNADFLVI